MIVIIIGMIHEIVYTMYENHKLKKPFDMHRIQFTVAFVLSKQGGRMPLFAVL